MVGDDDDVVGDDDDVADDDDAEGDDDDDAAGGSCECRVDSARGPAGGMLLLALAGLLLRRR
jgi:MYXO-CTERM domain-containing protein